MLFVLQKIRRFYMKKIHKVILPLLCSLAIIFLLPIVALGVGDENMDGGSGNMGNATSQDYWNNQDGIRVTVVNTNGKKVVMSFDLSNYSVADNTIHFRTISKIKYTSGTALLPSSNSYKHSKPQISLPRIISGGVNKANIETIKKYFCSEYTAKLIANKCGIKYEEFISGKYKLIIEPVAYFVHGGRDYAMTATEAALYNQMSGGSLRSKMPSLTHQNLPLSIFLEFPDLGYPAWNGTTSGKVSDSEIISSLGIGIVSYQGNEKPDNNPAEGPDKSEKPETDIEAPDEVYRVDTDVITSITLSTNREITPENPATVTFYIDGSTYTVNDIVIPEGGSQLVWVRWHTPSTPQTVTIRVSVSGASTGKTTLKAKIISLEENLPPDPLATDTNQKFKIPFIPSNFQKTTAGWSVWDAEWKSDWKWESNWRWEGTGHHMECEEDCQKEHGNWVDYGDWVDYGKWEYEATTYTASLTGSMTIMPDDIVPTASGKKMKSGYGVKENVTAILSTNASSSDYTTAQTAVSYFPEFQYEKYWRILECKDGMTAKFQFKPNEYSTYNRNVHFTPVWYPDKKYTIYTYVIDVWTPAGMLSINLNDYIEIEGSVYDDWHTKRE